VAFGSTLPLSVALTGAVFPFGTTFSSFFGSTLTGSCSAACLALSLACHF